MFAALVTGFLAARLAWLFLRPALEVPAFLRKNYRGHTLPTAAGLVVAAATFLVESGRAVAGALGVGDAVLVTLPRVLTLLAVAGFTLLGMADDLGAVGNAQGFRGHLRALRQGVLTTGGLKLVGGAMLALLLAGPAGQLGGQEAGAKALGWLVVDGAVIGLSANLANLFDRAPGRTVKISAIAFVLLVAGVAIGGDVARLAGPAVVVGAALGLLLDDLREHCMLGDTGANAIGAVLGLGLVVTGTRPVRVSALILLLALNLLSERVSFSRMIDSVRPLRALDRLGTRPERRAY